ncbi:MAG: hypothetical protein Kow00128_06240 [Deltaproteobacteria bacterium]
MTPLPSGRRVGIRLLASVAGVLLLSLIPSSGSANRFRLSPPGRDLPRQEEGGPPPGVTADEIRRLLAEGAIEGTTSQGARVVLTLDPRLQRDIFDLFRKFDPPYGVFAAVEPETGRVRALVGYRRGGESDPGLALKSLYPAASLVKVITAAAALEKGDLSPGEEIAYRGGIYRITRRSLHAKGGRGVRRMSLEQAIAKSANSVFGRVAVQHVGAEALEEYLERFGFGAPVPFDLPVERSRGEVPEDEVSLARTGAGLGEVYVSPLHMATIMAAIGSSGRMPRPRLVDRVEGAGGEIFYRALPERWRDTVKPETADTLLRMMVRTIEEGTSHRAFGSPRSTPLLRDMEVAGKTGSVSGWSPRMRFEWFAGIAPVDGPMLSVAALVVNNGRWRIKGSYVGKEAFNSYFGYPHSNPPPARKHRGRKRIRRRRGNRKPPSGPAPRRTTARTKKSAGG